MSEYVQPEELEAIRRRDQASGAMWFIGPASFTAQAARDRRLLLAHVARLEEAEEHARQVVQQTRAALGAPFDGTTSIIDFAAQMRAKLDEKGALALPKIPNPSGHSLTEDSSRGKPSGPGGLGSV